MQLEAHNFTYQQPTIVYNIHKTLIESNPGKAVPCNPIHTSPQNTGGRKPLKNKPIKSFFWHRL